MKPPKIEVFMELDADEPKYLARWFRNGVWFTSTGKTKLEAKMKSLQFWQKEIGSKKRDSG